MCLTVFLSAMINTSAFILRPLFLVPPFLVVYLSLKAAILTVIIDISVSMPVSIARGWAFHYPVVYVYVSAHPSISTSLTTRFPFLLPSYAPYTDRTQSRCPACHAQYAPTSFLPCAFSFPFFPLPILSSVIFLHAPLSASPKYVNK